MLDVEGNIELVKCLLGALSGSYQAEIKVGFQIAAVPDSDQIGKFLHQADIDTIMYYGSQMVVMVMADGCARRVSGSGQVARH